MSTTESRSPGWHPDPEDPTSLRHWDGKRWGHERQARPSWASPADPADPDHRKRSRRRWYLLAAGAAVFAVAVITVPSWLGGGLKIPPRSVSDAAFTEKAEAVCAKALPKLRTDRPESRDDNGTPAAFAGRIEKAAAGLEAVTADLRAIPLSNADAKDSTRVDGWLDDWAAYTTIGHRFATAIKAEDKDLSKNLSAEGQVISKRIYLFSKANDMPGCVF